MQATEDHSANLFWHDRVHHSCRDVQEQLTAVLHKMRRGSHQRDRVRLSIFSSEEFTIAAISQMHSVIHCE